MKKFWGTIKEIWSRGAVGFENIEAPEEEAAGVELIELEMSEIPHAEPGAFQAVKDAIMGHGEQTVLPDDCEFGDNELCHVES